MAGNIIERVSPPITNFRDNVSVHMGSMECCGTELVAMTSSAFSAAAFSANLVVYIPIVTVEPMVVSHFWWFNGATLDAAGHVDMGIYNFDGSSLLVSTGPTTPSGVSTLQVVDVTDLTLGANQRYWMAFGCDSGTQTFSRSTLIAPGLDLLGVKQQVGGYSGGLPASATFAVPTVANTPMFGFSKGAL